MKLDKNEFTHDTKMIEEQFKQIGFALGDLNNNIKSTDNFMEKYQPIKFLQLLIESLSHILDKKQIKKLEDFQQIKYKSLHGTILEDNGLP